MFRRENVILQDVQYKNALKGSFTVEMSLLTPFLLFVIMGCILVVFYYHDKNILSGAAYETAVVGSTLAREKDGVEESRLEELCRERINGKCILFGSLKVGITIEDKMIEVSVSARRRKMKAHVMQKAVLTQPEKYIRKLRKIKETVQQ